MNDALGMFAIMVALVLSIVTSGIAFEMIARRRGDDAVAWVGLYYTLPSSRLANWSWPTARLRLDGEGGHLEQNRSNWLLAPPWTPWALWSILTRSGLDIRFSWRDVESMVEGKVGKVRIVFARPAENASREEDGPLRELVLKTPSKRARERVLDAARAAGVEVVGK